MAVAGLKAGPNLMEGYFHNCRREIEPMLPAAFDSVIEIGCGAAQTMTWMRGCWPEVRYLGLEISEVAAAEGRRAGIDVRTCDFESMSDDDLRQLGRFKVVLAMDVLEHFKDPWSAIAKIKSLVAPEGVLIASIPNVRYGPVLWNLVARGRWEYTDSGILDRTHLRFFTRDSAVELVKESFDVLDVRPLHMRRAAFLNAVTLGLFSDFLALQFLIKGRPRSQSAMR